MDEIFEIDTTAVLGEVAKTAVTHWINKDTEGRKLRNRYLLYRMNKAVTVNYF